MRGSASIRKLSTITDKIWRIVETHPYSVDWLNVTQTNKWLISNQCFRVDTQNTTRKEFKTQRERNASSSISGSNHLTWDLRHTHCERLTDSYPSVNLRSRCICITRSLVNCLYVWISKSNKKPITHYLPIAQSYSHTVSQSLSECNHTINEDKNYPHNHTITQLPNTQLHYYRIKVLLSDKCPNASTQSTTPYTIIQSHNHTITNFNHRITIPD